MSPGAVGAPMMPMMHRPAPPRAKSSSGAGVAIAVVVCLALAGLFGFRLFGRGYGSRPQVEATVEKSTPLRACPEVMNREETVSSFPDDGPIDAYLASLVGKRSRRVR